MSIKIDNPASPHRRHALATMVSLVAAASATPVLLAACGGGGDTPAAGGGATPQSFTTGRISGLGSIIVNGVRFDDNGAHVEDDEDGTSHTSRELKLGMMVEVEASSINDVAATAVASVIRFGSEMVGPVSAVDATGQTLTLLGQTVEIRPETVFDPTISGGLTGISVGQVLEIHALFNATSGHYIATRVEREDGAAVYKLRGLVSALNTTDKTFQIGTAVINYGGVAADQLPANLANGVRVRVRLQNPLNASGQWVAIRVRSGVRRVEDIGDARIIGLVTDFTSPQQFSVQGVPINATNATFEPNAAAVRKDVLVAVRGTASNGTIIATRVRVVDALADDDWRLIELHGSVGELSAGPKTFMLREVLVDYSQVLRWKDGVPADLVNGRNVEVKGVWSADRSKLLAGIIEFE